MNERPEPTPEEREAAARLLKEAIGWRGEGIHGSTPSTERPSLGASVYRLPVKQ